jgi:hypothetical protein
MASKPKTRPKRAVTPEVTCDGVARLEIWKHYAIHGAPRIKEIARQEVSRMAAKDVREK